MYNHLDPIMNTDFYKTGHIYQYPEKTELVFSNLTPRSARLFRSPLPVDGVVVFGVQAVIQNLHESFDEKFFKKDIEVICKKYQKRMNMCLGVGKVKTDHIRALHALGHLPVEIRALEEGSICPIQVPLLTIHNTKPEFFWLVNYLETVLSDELWSPITSATIALHYRRLVDGFAAETGVLNEVDQGFQCHDFSMRGLMGTAAASASGAAHLTSFTGTDTIPALDYLEYYYDASPDEFIAGSVPATEHSVMCMGTQDGEFDTYKRLIEMYPEGIVSIVSDTWDFWQVMTNFAVRLKDTIMARDGKVVFRPDSGDPVKILTGYKWISFESAKQILAKHDNLRLYGSVSDAKTAKEFVGHEFLHLNNLGYEVVVEKVDDYQSKMCCYKIERVSEIEVKVKSDETLTQAELDGAVQTLYNTFGGTLTSNGYKVLDSHVGLLYGDSITLDRAQQIMQRLKDKGFASNNVVFGVGSFTYQYNTRDTFGFAVKATAGKVDGKFISIMKDPKTGDGGKKSAKGFLIVTDKRDRQTNKLIYSLEQDVPFDVMCNSMGNKLIVRYSDGKFLYRTDIDRIREVLKAYR